MIKVKNVSKVYRGRDGHSVGALQDVNLEIKEREFVVITGPSGSGKSTLLFTLGAMLQPTSGEVLLDGVRLYDLTPAERAEMRRLQVGFVFQTFN
ncbi:MAG: ATP-binding cassette domain-containing protein, partial [Deltaproteobacteria bacterium]|nr:ATP-binding cassette domain-containing protein [Deltaproteobacteria bacterium]